MSAAGLQGSVVDHATAAHARFCRAGGGGREGALDRHGVRCALAAVTGRVPCAAEIDALMGACGDAGVTATALGRYAQERALPLTAADADAAAVREAFRALDDRCEGYISREALQRAAKECGLLAERGAEFAFELDAAFQELDEDGDGRLSAREFFVAMTSRGGASHLPSAAPAHVRQCGHACAT